MRPTPEPGTPAATNEADRKASERDAITDARAKLATAKARHKRDEPAPPPLAPLPITAADTDTGTDRSEPCA